MSGRRNSVDASVGDDTAKLRCRQTILQVVSELVAQGQVFDKVGRERYQASLGSQIGDERTKPRYYFIQEHNNLC